MQTSLFALALGFLVGALLTAVGYAIGYNGRLASALALAVLLVCTLRQAYQHDEEAH